jgi:hypothetical protein
MLRDIAKVGAVLPLLCRTLATAEQAGRSNTDVHFSPALMQCW